MYKNYCKYLLLSILLIFLASPFITGQHIELIIRITDKENAKPIDLANVYITPCDCGGTTDENGTISVFLEKGNYQIITSYLGYENDTTQISFVKKMRRTISLSSRAFLLEDVIVSGQNTTSNIERTQMGVQQLNAVQLKVLPTAIGETDVLRGLTMLSGVGAAGEASNGLSIRGGSLDQNLVLLDYAPIFNPTHLFGLFSVFTPDAVSDVNLYRANIPARFGGRIASVLDIKVKNPNAEKFTLSGGIGLVSSRLSVETPLIEDKLVLLASTRVAYNEFLFPVIKKLKNTRANFWDGTVKLKWKPSKNDNIFWTGFYSHDFYQLDIISKINNVNSSSNQYDYSIFNNTLNWLHTFHKNAYLQTTLVSSDYRPSILFPQLDTDNTIAYESRIQHRSLTSELTKTFNEKLFTSIGLQGSQHILSPGSFYPGNTEGLDEVVLADENSYELSAFVDAEWSPSEKLAISGGLRFTQFLLMGAFEEAHYADPFMKNISDVVMYGKGELVKGYNGLEPRLGLRWKFSENTSFKASYARSQQYLQNIFNSSTPLPTSRWKTADRYILPQKGHTYSFGIYHNLQDNNIALSLEAYFRDIDNVLDYKPGADFFLQKFIERDVVQGKGRSKGLEFNFEKPEGEFNGWFNYSWAKSIRKFEEPNARSRINNNQWFPSDFDRPHVFNGTLNWEANEFNVFSFNFTLQTGRPYTVASAVFEIDNVPVPIFLERNNARLPAYHRLDFSWRIHNITTNKEKRWKGDWIFTVYNLYSRKNASNIFYGGTQNGRFGTIFSGSPLGAYQLSIFSSVVVSLGYSFVFE
ncbi:MAG: TonB-dependent receptor [Bacteroidetes bacterium]|nr:TonB-dependent receptor [Bacteroidota bacterium]